MALRLGDNCPDFSFLSTANKSVPDTFYRWAGDKWVVLFSHPADFTPVCTTELGKIGILAEEFKKRDTKVIGLSTNDVKEHLDWIADIEETQGSIVEFPIIADTDRKISTLYGMLDQTANDPTNIDGSSGLPLTIRTVFIIDPLKRNRLMLAYPAAVGRNFEEILRVLDALQLGDKYKIATPADWKPGEEVIIRVDVDDAEAGKLFPNYRAVKSYLRYTNI